MTTGNPPFSDEGLEPNEDSPATMDEPNAESQPLSIATPGETETADLGPAPKPPGPTVTFQGNSYDLSSVVAVTIGSLVLLSCVTCNMSSYIVPCLPIVLGVFGLVTARQAVDPERTKQLSWVSIGAGLVILLLIGLFVLAYIGIAFFLVSSGEFSSF